VNRARAVLVSLTLLAGACTAEPGGGGVNIEPTGATSSPTTTSTSTTTTTTPPTTTTTIPTYQLTGRVVRPNGTPVARATVAMGEITTTTDHMGSFTLVTSKPDTMRVSKLGWAGAEIPWDETVRHFEATIVPGTVRGLRISPEAAASDEAFDDLIALADQTAVNAFVFDTKLEGGIVPYESQLPEAQAIGAVDVIYDPAARVAETHEHGIYAITRVVVFEDGRRSAAYPDERLVGGWLDPRSPAGRAYVIALAVESCDLGFDEIQFDYVRYPAGRAAESSGQLSLTQEERVTAIADFLAEARAALHPMGCAVGADIFGIVTSTDDDQGLGQRPEELSAHVDSLSPMVYPSHYSNGWLGFEDPNSRPYEVTADAISDAVPRMAEGSVLRPWLQAFWWSNDQIRQAIRAAEDLGVGWMLWNIGSNYDAAALPTDEEVNR